jgi:hypothetical protein
MNPATFLLETDTQSRQLSRAVVLEVRPDGTTLCACDADGPEAVPCQMLQTSEGPGLRLSPGDTVLVWHSAGDEDYGVILGRLGSSSVPAPKQEETPDELIIEAKKELTLKCGDGSITLRGDGKILIKGKDLVSRAERLNRIKGGAVAIN